MWLMFSGSEAQGCRLLCWFEKLGLGFRISVWFTELRIS